ncbi:Amino acid transporter, transmembrane [Corchorus olitorius]|uniref:Amino acid transporter, transmembrane n=1 Tax=Corchorus olitorius TaxID=93759 RepID=A0A1R3GNB2_9ROSI|nr:Amino acid transporter, transmembrane [Corchorus olitorius]
MEAHSLLKKQGFDVCSYGTGAHVKQLMVPLNACCVEYISLEGDNLSALFPNAHLSLGGIKLSAPHLFAMTLAVLPTVWLRDLSVLSYISGRRLTSMLYCVTVFQCLSQSVLSLISAGGVVASILVVLCLWWVGLVDTIGFHHKGTTLNLSTLPVAIGLYGYCYYGHSVFPNIYTSMAKPNQFPSVLLACGLMGGKATVFNGHAQLKNVAAEKSSNSVSVVYTMPKKEGSRAATRTATSPIIMPQYMPLAMFQTPAPAPSLPPPAIPGISFILRQFFPTLDYLQAWTYRMCLDSGVMKVENSEGGQIVISSHLKTAFENAFRKMYILPSNLEALPPMPKDDGHWSALNSWVFVDSLDALHTNSSEVNLCLLGSSELENKHCYCRILELLVNVWAYHSMRRMVYMDPQTGFLEEQHPVEHRKEFIWARYFNFMLLKSMDEDLAEAADDEDHVRKNWLWQLLTGEVHWQGIYEREREERYRLKMDKKRKNKEKLFERMKNGYKQRSLG